LLIGSLDHLILGVNDLASGIGYVERRTGIRAAFGGAHPGRGTQNALLSLGLRCYLEILAPDPQQTLVTWFRELSDCTEPRLLGWMARVADIEAFAERLRELGIAHEGPHESFRVRPDGRTLRWKLLRLLDNSHRLLPASFIEWNTASQHPAEDSPSGLRLVGFEVASPTPEELQAAANRMSLQLAVTWSKAPQLRAQIVGPKGKLELHSR
jgi:hypothetical protein